MAYYPRCNNPKLLIDMMLFYYCSWVDHYCILKFLLGICMRDMTALSLTLILLRITSLVLFFHFGYLSHYLPHLLRSQIEVRRLPHIEIASTLQRGEIVEDLPVLIK
jgi:hypothetical protein